MNRGRIIDSWINPEWSPFPASVVCNLYAASGACGVFAVLPGTRAPDVGSVQPIEWSTAPNGGFVRMAMSLINSKGRTGEFVVLDAIQLHALYTTRLLDRLFSVLMWDHDRVPNAWVVVRQAVEIADWQGESSGLILGANIGDTACARLARKVTAAPDSIIAPEGTLPRSLRPGGLT